MSSRLPDQSSRLCGVLVVDKPRGPTSARVARAVGKQLGVRRVGHTGTLDPMATGVLPVCLGEATKLAGFLLASDKSYRAEIVLGISTDTLDADGAVTGGDPGLAAAVREADVRAAIAELSGDISQVPPMYSALRVSGKRLHELARAGLEVPREPRSVRVEAFNIERFEAPHLEVSVRCSKGTYIRSLARDLGAALGCGAHLAALRRTAAGRFTLAEAISLEAIEAADDAAIGRALIAPAAALGHLPAVSVGDALIGRIRNGLQLRWEQLEAADPPPSGRFSLLEPGGGLLAVARLEDGALAYDRVFQGAM